MAKKRESGQMASARRWLAALMAGSVGLGVTLISGCSQTPVANSQPPGDPLHGVLTPPGMPPPTSAPRASAGWNQAPSQQFGSADSTSTNNATLASMAWQGPLGKPLAMDDTAKTQTPTQLTTGGAKTQPAPVTPGFTPPNPNPKVEPIPDAKPATPPLTPTGSWQPVQQTPQPAVQTVGASSAPSVSNDALDKQLQDRGVINQKLDQVPEGVKLTCYVARPGGAGFRILEATAVDYASAAQAIVQQLAR